MKRVYPGFYFTIALLCISALSYSQKETSWKAKFETSKVFIENKGQFTTLTKNNVGSDEILFAVDYGTTKIFFTKTGVIYNFIKAKSKEEGEYNQYLVEAKGSFDEWKEREEKEKRREYEIEESRFIWENANTDVEIIAQNPSNDYYSYSFKENGEVKNINFINAYKKITYKNLYNNIDVEYTFHPEDGIKYAIILHPGADISSLQMTYENPIALASNGDLHITTLFGDIIDHAPKTFYTENSNTTIDSYFLINGNSAGFGLGNYDNTKSVTIDPWTQTPSLSNSNCIWECDRDASGNVYIIGGDVPLRLQKYDAAGVLQWTYTTPWDTSASGDWLGTLATDLAGNSYVTNGSSAELEKISTSGAMTYHVNGGALDEYWKISFNCDQTKLIIGGTRLSMFPPADSYGMIFDINASNGSVNNTQIVGYGRPYTLMGLSVTDIDEVRSISSSRNAKYYFMTLDSLGAINQDIGSCPTGEAVFKIPHTYSLGYKCEDFRPNNGNAGISSIRANRYFVYTSNGTEIHKRSLANGSILATATITGGINNTTAGTTPLLHSIGNSGIDIDSCGNVYVGSGNAVIEYDADLNLLTSVATSFRVYDVCVSTGGNIIVCGGTGNNSSTTRTGYIQSINMAACDPMTLYCCDANICPVSSFCNTDAPANLTASTPGGTWSGTGITDGAAGTFDPGIAGGGTHTVYYTLACGTDSVEITVLLCASLSVCLEENGDISVSGGTGPYTWETGTSFTDCSGCFMGICTPPICNGVFTTTWTNFGSGNTVTPPVGSDTIRVTDSNLNTFIIYDITSLSPCPDCPPMNISSSSTNIACYGQSTGSITGTPPAGGPTYDYLLINSGGTTIANLTGVSGSQSFNNLPAGTYYLTITDTADCDTVITITLTQPASFTQTYTIVDEICQNSCTGSISLNITGGNPPFSYDWSNGDTNATLTDLCSATYTVTFTDANGCVYDSSATIDYSIAASFDAVPPSGEPPLTVTFNYTGTPGIAYYWDFGDSSTDSTENPVHTYTEPGSYNAVLIVYIDSVSSCTVNFTVIVEAPSFLVVPNVFTPDGNGFNDLFIIQNAGLESFSCIIFNRWGRRIYEWTDPAAGWDGKTIAGKIADDGVYFYVLTAEGKDGVKYDYHGTVTLLKQ